MIVPFFHAYEIPALTPVLSMLIGEVETSCVDILILKCLFSLNLNNNVNEIDRVMYRRYTTYATHSHTESTTHLATNVYPSPDCMGIA
jgi:hypothetical protein